MINRKQENHAFLENCLSHKITFKMKNIDPSFLPKNSTSKTRPLDNGIIRSFKTKLYDYHIKNIIMNISETINADSLYKLIFKMQFFIY